MWFDKRELMSMEEIEKTIKDCDRQQAILNKCWIALAIFMGGLFIAGAIIG